jgi:hypothetical protein
MCSHQAGVFVEDVQEKKKREQRMRNKAMGLDQEGDIPGYADDSDEDMLLSAQ